MRKTEVWLSFLLLLVLLAGLASAQSVWSANSMGGEKNAFTNLDKVYAKSIIICGQAAMEVDLYVVEDKQSWVGGDALVDVRESSQSIELVGSKIPVTQIWVNPASGNYDIVVDCDRNGQYDLYKDNVDDLGDIGFVVKVTAGKGKAQPGENNIESHSWMYDVEEPDLINEMLQFSLSAEGEDIALSNITIKAAGTGNDLGIDNVEVYADENNNGKLDNEVLVGEGKYLVDNGEIIVSLDSVLTKDSVQNFLVVYFMKEDASEGEYSLSVKSVFGVGQDSGKAIRFLGLPINSETKTVLPEKTCFGELQLVLEPNPVLKEQKVMAKMDGLEGCGGKKISLRPNPCASSLKTEICFCTLADGGCQCSFTSSISRTYYACIDKNGDGDMVDFGEYALEDLIITKPEVPEITEIVNETEITEEEIGEIEETTEIEEQAPITGAATGLREKLVSADSFLILLEITLLLILFILVMILFRLKGTKPIMAEPIVAKETEKSE